MSAHVVRLGFPSKAEYLILARLALAGIGRSVSLDEEVLADLKLAVTEACANAVKHAYGDGVGEVRVRFAVDDDTIEIDVEDDGAGFAVDELREHDRNGEPVTEGMGIPLIRAIADELTLEPRDGGGTLLRIRKAVARDTASRT